MKKTVLVVLAATMALAACTTTDPYTGEQKVSNTAGGAALGALAGAGVGLLAGGDDRRNALIGAGIGALAGGAVGSVMDRNEAELQGAAARHRRQRHPRRRPHRAQHAVRHHLRHRPGFGEVAVLSGAEFGRRWCLKKFNQTIVDVYGYTNSTGDDTYNYNLSQRRALAVANYLSSQGVDSRRFAVTGFGETRPIADNNTPAGRAQNRRVEIQLSPLT